MIDTKVAIGQRYTWTKYADTVVVKDIEKGFNDIRDLAYVEIITSKDSKFKAGQKIWVFGEDLRLVK